MQKIDNSDSAINANVQTANEMWAEIKRVSAAVAATDDSKTRALKKEWSEKKVNDRIGYFQSLGYNDFITKFAVPVRYMVSYTEYREDVFRKYLARLKTLGYNSQDDWIDRQADYVKMLWRAYHPHARTTEAQLEWKRARESIKDEMDSFKTDYDKAKVKADERKKVVDDDHRGILKNLLDKDPRGRERLEQMYKAFISRQTGSTASDTDIYAAAAADVAEQVAAAELSDGKFHIDEEKDKQIRDNIAAIEELEKEIGETNGAVAIQPVELEVKHNAEPEEILNARQYTGNERTIKKKKAKDAKRIREVEEKTAEEQNAVLKQMLNEFHESTKPPPEPVKINLSGLSQSERRRKLAKLAKANTVETKPVKSAEQIAAREAERTARAAARKAEREQKHDAEKDRLRKNYEAKQLKKEAKIVRKVNKNQAESHLNESHLDNSNDDLSELSD